MKKNNGSNNGSNKGNGKGKEAPARASLKWREVAAIMGDKLESENKVEFDLVDRQKGLPTVTLTIYPSDNAYDNAVLNAFGIAIRVMVRQGKSGFFLSMPSQKGKDGNYYDQVSCYDKDFHSMTKELLAAYYGDETEAD